MKLFGKRLQRFTDKIEHHPSGCWLWVGAIVQNSGYGQFGVGRLNGKPIRKLAHRVAYEHFVGEIPEGLDLDHLCRVRNCVNPDHLEPVTRQENFKRSPIHAGSATHCPNGHPYSGENLLVVNASDGMRRRCRICKKETARRYEKRKEGLHEGKWYLPKPTISTTA